MTPMYVHLYLAQITVMPLFSHLHNLKAGFFVMRVIRKLEDMKAYINSKKSICICQLSVK